MTLSDEDGEGALCFMFVDEDKNVRHLDLVPSLEKLRDGLCVKRTSRIGLPRDATRIVEKDFQNFAKRIEPRVFQKRFHSLKLVCELLFVSLARRPQM